MGRLIALALLSLVCANTAQARPQRVASVNLCTDEYLLLLADHEQILSVTKLGADIQETPLAVRAKGKLVNNGRLSSIITHKPDLLITGGYTEPFSVALAQHLNIPTLNLPPPTTPEDVRRNLRTLARALGQEARAEQVIARYDAVLAHPPARTVRGALVEGGGYTISHTGLAATYLRAAGIQQIAAGERLSYELLLRTPPEVIVLSRYHEGQASTYQQWLAHPALARVRERAQFIPMDGRSWTCLGPMAAEAIPALRKAVAR